MLTISKETYKYGTLKNMNKLIFLYLSKPEKSVN